MRVVTNNNKVTYSVQSRQTDVFLWILVSAEFDVCKTQL